MSGRGHRPHRDRPNERPGYWQGGVWYGPEPPTAAQQGLNLVYQATVNVPGYLPDDTEQHLFDTPDAAWNWLADEQMRFEDSLDGEAYSATVDKLAALGEAANWNGTEDQVKDWLVDNGLAEDGTGSVTLDLNGGLVFTVTAVPG